jgi:predicted RNA-binding Zn ribbon-like protein
VPRYDLPKAAPAPLELVRRFVNTVDREHGREWLPTPDALEAWCDEHGLELGSAVSEHDLRRALDVREAIRSLARANNGGEVPREAVSTFNHALRAARVEIALDARGAPTTGAGADAVDGALGRLLAIVLTSMLDGSWARVKACRQCSWLFYDYSSNRSATWCSMAICGNRRKTRAYRTRRTRPPRR